MFKVCNKCFYEWESRDDFLSDGSIKLIGYQVFFEDLKLGLFLFNHTCQTTIAVETSHFLDLYTGPFFTERKNPKKDCPGHCLNKNILSPCSEECKCAFVRNIIQAINTWNKHNKSASFS